MIPPLFLAAAWAIRSRRIVAYVVLAVVVALHDTAGMLQIGVNTLLLLGAFADLLRLPRAADDGEPPADDRAGGRLRRARHGPGRPVRPADRRGDAGGVQQEQPVPGVPGDAVRERRDVLLPAGVRAVLPELDLRDLPGRRGLEQPVRARQHRPAAAGGARAGGAPEGPSRPAADLLLLPRRAGLLPRAVHVVPAGLAGEHPADPESAVAEARQRGGGLLPGGGRRLRGGVAAARRSAGGALAAGGGRAGARQHHPHRDRAAGRDGPGRPADGGDLPRGDPHARADPAGRALAGPPCADGRPGGDDRDGRRGRRVLGLPAARATTTSRCWPCGSGSARCWRRPACWRRGACPCPRWRPGWWPSAPTPGW